VLSHGGLLFSDGLPASGATNKTDIMTEAIMKKGKTENTPGTHQKKHI